MENPSIGELTTVINAFETINMAHSNLKDQYDLKQEAIMQLMPEALFVVKKIWDETNTYYNEETPSNKRRKAREWGVYYESKISHTINVWIKNSLTMEPVGGVQVEIIETGLKQTTLADGRCALRTRASETVTLRSTHAGYAAQDNVVVIETGKTVYDVAISMVPA